MKHGILLTVHNNIPVVQTLLRMLDDRRFTFYLMVDRKSKYSPSDFLPELKNAQVRILPRIHVNWAGYSQIEAELQLIAAALEDRQDYMHFLQGADLPLKTPDQIDRFFLQGGVFMDIFPDPDGFAHYKVICKHLFANFRAFRPSKLLRLVDHGLAHLQKPFVRCSKMYGHLYSGSATWSIPAAFAEFIWNKRHEIKKCYRCTLAADEVFIHSLCMNSDFRKQISPAGGARFIDWKHREGNSPKTFTMADREVLDQAILDPNIMFARKFNTACDSDITIYVFNRVTS